MKKNKIIVLVLIIVVIFILGFVFLDKQKNKNIDKVNLYLSWTHQSEFAGSYIAKEKGFYEKENLDVNIVPFDFESTLSDLVIQPGFNFGIMGSDQLIIAREKGYPIKAIAAIYKENPATMYSLKENNITKPQDFLNKKIGLQKGSNSSYLYDAMMSNLGLDRSNIKEMEIGHGVKEILSKEIDVSTGYVINEPNLVKESGIDVDIILMSDYGVNLYGDVIFTSEDLIETNPDLVNRFLRATLDGWQYAIENQEEASVIVLKYSKEESTLEHQYNMLKDSIPFISDGESFLGWMDKDQWQRSYNVLFDQKVTSKAINVTDLYTVEFLADYYLNKKR